MNIYYEDEDNIYQDDIIESSKESSFHDINKEDQWNSINEEGQKLSGTFSTRKKNKICCGTPHIYNKCPTVYNVEKLYCRDTKKYFYIRFKKKIKYTNC